MFIVLDMLVNELIKLIDNIIIFVFNLIYCCVFVIIRVYYVKYCVDIRMYEEYVNFFLVDL